MLVVISQDSLTIRKTFNGMWHLVEEKMLSTEPPLAESLIEQFKTHYDAWQSGAESAFIREDELEPVMDFPDLLSQEASLPLSALLDHVVLIKLNGGLGTTMGLDIPKSLLSVRDELTFLDIFLNQVESLNIESGHQVPVVLMNSFSTDKPTKDYLAEHGWDKRLNIHTVLQGQVPKLLPAGNPVDWPQDRVKEWCPPGHGDLYRTLFSSGVWDTLLEQGKEYAFVSNIDNLGATFEPALLDQLRISEAPLLMEVTERLPQDSKGGHLAYHKELERIILREKAQCAGEDLTFFQDIKRYRYFNTNNIWLNLTRLREVFPFSLPGIVNQKTVDPVDRSSPVVYQLESAMGAAVALFKDVVFCNVPRTRFAPVKSLSDLLVVSSDLYQLDSRGRLTATVEKLPLVKLKGYPQRSYESYQETFPFGSPRLKDAEYFEVDGRFVFSEGVSIEGSVTLKNHKKEAVVIDPHQCLFKDIEIGGS